MATSGERPRCIRHPAKRAVFPFDYAARGFKHPCYCSLHCASEAAIEDMIDLRWCEKHAEWWNLGDGAACDACNMDAEQEEQDARARCLQCIKGTDHDLSDCDTNGRNDDV